MNQEETVSLQREAFRNGVGHSVTIRLGRSFLPPNFLRYSIEINGPFGNVRAEDDDQFGALQLARRRFESQGWLLAVEGSRLRSHPSGMQRDQAGGRVAYRLDDTTADTDQGAYPVRSIMDAVDANECATVVEQERWYQRWHSRWSSTPKIVNGRGWRMLVPDLTNGRAVYQPMTDGLPVMAKDSEANVVAALYTDRIDALAAGLESPRRIDLDRVRAEFPHGIVIDPDTLWESSAAPVAPARLPRLRLGAESQDPRVEASLPGALVVPSKDDASSLLIILPAGSDLDGAAASLAAAVGAALIPPLVVVVAGTEPGSVRRSLKRRS